MMAGWAIRRASRLAPRLAGWCAVALLATAMVAAAPQQKDVRLAEAFAARLEAIADDVDGLVSYQIVDVTSGQAWGRRADEPFPTASAIKVGILYELFRQADEGRVRLDETQPLDPAQRAGGSGVLQHLTAPTLSARDHAVLMMLLSDNTSTNVLIDRLGMGAITRRMVALGASSFSLERRMMDADAVARGAENVASAADLVRILDLLRRGEGLSAQGRDEAVRIMRLPGQTALRAGVPAGVEVASKPGGLPGVRTEVGWVELKGRPYLLAVMCSYLVDERDGDRAITEMSRAAYQYFDRLARAGREGRLR